MTRWCLLGLLAAGPALAQQQTGAPAGIAVPAPPVVVSSTGSDVAVPAAAVFRVRVVDGRNGAAVAGAHVQLWYDEPSGAGYEFVTNGQGIGLMPQPVGEPVRVLGAVTDYVDCRKTAQGAPPEGYNLQAIAKGGVAGENGCGRVAVRTSAGELVLYVRPVRWYEGINRGISH